MRRKPRPTHLSNEKGRQRRPWNWRSNASGERKHIYDDHHIAHRGELSNSVLAPLASHIEVRLIERHRVRPSTQSNDSEASQSKSNSPNPIIEASSSTVYLCPVFHRSINVSPALREAHHRWPNRVFRCSRICASNAEARRKSAE